MNWFAARRAVYRLFYGTKQENFDRLRFEEAERKADGGEFSEKFQRTNRELRYLSAIGIVAKHLKIDKSELTSKLEAFEMHEFYLYLDSKEV